MARESSQTNSIQTTGHFPGTLFPNITRSHFLGFEGTSSSRRLSASQGLQPGKRPSGLRLPPWEDPTSDLTPDHGFHACIKTRLTCQPLCITICAWRIYRPILFAHALSDIISASETILRFSFLYRSMFRTQHIGGAYGSLRICSKHMRQQNVVLNTMQPAAIRKEIGFSSRRSTLWLGLLSSTSISGQQRKPWDRTRCHDRLPLSSSVPCRGKTGHSFHDLKLYDKVRHNVISRAVECSGTLRQYNTTTRFGFSSSDQYPLHFLSLSA